MKFTEVLESFAFDGALRGRVADNWLQGRTLYGGMTAALSLESALRALPDLPPLRSAQIAFVGPAEGALSITSTILRKGKSVTFVNADLVAERGLAARTVFAFGGARESKITANFIADPQKPSASSLEKLGEHKFTAPFARNFDRCFASGGIPFTGSRDCNMYFWARHRDEKATSIPALLALADMPPPAVMPMFTERAPISTMTWALNFLTDHPSTEDGWWLLQTRAENASEGYSSQDMFVWNAFGAPVIAGRQSVAIFQ